MKIQKLLVVGALAVALSVPQPVSAETPTGCNSNAVGISITPYLLGSPTTGPVAAGDVITYEVTLSVPPSGGAVLHCNYSGGELSVTLPDGSYVQVAGFGGTTPDVPTVTEASPWTVVCPDTYTVTTADVLAGSITAYADYGDTYPGQENGTFDSTVPQQSASASTSNALLTECPEPCVGITKTVSPEFSKVGDEVTYTICVSNCGTFDLTDVVVSDPLLGGVLSSFPTTLTPGQMECRDFLYVVQPGDPDPLTNTATVTANDECDGDPITAQASATLDLKEACIDIEKTCEPPTASVGDLITYTITISNCGTAEDGLDLENVTVSDSLLGDLSASFVDTLAVGASDTQSFTRALEATDPNPLVNIATVNATAVTLGNPVEAQDECEVGVAGEEGCTPGYWKNSPGCWECYGPETSFSSVFSVVIEVRAGGKNTISDPTLMQALEATGGGVNALARHAVAAILNACDDDIAYPMSQGQIIDAVHDAIMSGDEGEINSLKDMLDMYNNYGCPQSADNANEPCSPTDDEAPV